LERKPDGELVLADYTGKAPPAHTHTIAGLAVGIPKAVSFQQLDARSGKSKAGWQR
jgi:hypothetical protein